jgi:hypothetical protein
VALPHVGDLPRATIPSHCDAHLECLRRRAKRRRRRPFASSGVSGYVLTGKHDYLIGLRKWGRTQIDVDCFVGDQEENLIWRGDSGSQLDQIAEHDRRQSSHVRKDALADRGGYDG